MKVIKRDGRIVEFDPRLIEYAILKAFNAVDKEMSDYAVMKARNIAEYIQDYYTKEKTTPSVEDIQDLVEKGLMSTKRKDVAKEYITYRNKRNEVRNRNTQLRKKIKEKLAATNVQNQNANVDEKSFGGRMGEAGSEMFRDIGLNDGYMSDMAKNNHLNNMIYYHDLDHLVVGDHNCLSIPFDKVLQGFNTRQTDVRAAGSVSTAFQLLAVIFQLQSLQQFGGVSATHLDWTMVPYVRKSFYKHYQIGMAYICDNENWNLKEQMEDEGKYKEISEIPIDDYGYYPNYSDDAGDFEKVYRYALNMTTRETYQAAESMYHNLNTLQSRSGNQLPFTSINYGTCTLPEGRMVIKALLEGSIAGIGSLHRTSIFPCGIFQCMKGVNRKPGDPNYDLYRLALKSTATRLYPNYANVDWSGNAGYDRNDPCTYFSTMGCRTANGWDVNGFGQLKDGRGNICPVTIILPTLAMMATESFMNEYDNNVVEVFMELLEQKIYEARDMLLERFEWICSQDPASAKFMYENGLMAGYVPEEGIRSALKHGTLAVG